MLVRKPAVKEMLKVGVLMRKARFQTLNSNGLFSGPIEGLCFCFNHIDPAAPLRAEESYDILLHKVIVKAMTSYRKES